MIYIYIYHRERDVHVYVCVYIYIYIYIIHIYVHEPSCHAILQRVLRLLRCTNTCIGLFTFISGTVCS